MITGSICPGVGWVKGARKARIRERQLAMHEVIRTANSGSISELAVLTARNRSR
jgi:hypothetical protein